MEERDPSGGLSAKTENHNGEKYAAYWKYAENRQHQL